MGMDKNRIKYHSTIKTKYVAVDDIIISVHNTQGTCKINQSISPLCRIYTSVNRVSIGSDSGLSPIRRQAIM